MRTDLNDSLARVGVKLLIAGVLVSLVAAVIGMGVLWLASSQTSALTLGLGAGLGIVALALGQTILTLASHASPMATFGIGMGAYAAAFILVVVVMSQLSKHTTLTMLWVAIGLMLAVFSYILAIAITYPRLRILYFSPADAAESEAPKDENS
ncbi:MAG: hypothetical protein FWD75_09900 [Propionibacteriaceae bacterium]|nr:hypothetical protein [Propionibacteriaceae bacterium]